MKLIAAWVVLATLAPVVNAATESEQRGIAVVAQDGSIGGHLNNEQVNLGRYRALLIGISAYQNPGFAGKLVTPVNDVRNLRQLLLEEYGFNDVTLLLEGEATRAGILRALTQLRDSDMGAQDSVLVYYAGHGYQKPETKDGFWVPVDGTAEESTWVPVSDITRIIKNFKSRHTLLISDSCFSGTLTRSALNLPTHDRYLAEVFRKDSYQVITSGGLEPVADGGRDGMSLFAYYLSSYLRDQPRSYVTASQMYSDLAPMVANASTSEQTPEHGKISGAYDQNGQFVLARVKRPGQATTVAMTTPSAPVGALPSAPAGKTLFAGFAFAPPGAKWQLQENLPNQSLKYARPDRGGSLAFNTAQMSATEIGQTIQEQCESNSKSTLQSVKSQKATKDAKLSNVNTETIRGLELCSYELTFKNIWLRSMTFLDRNMGRAFIVTFVFPGPFKDEGTGELRAIVDSIEVVAK